MMRLEDLNNLDFNDIRSWPLGIKVVGIVLIAGAIIFAGYWFVIKGQIETLERAQAREQQLRVQFLDKKELAINLPAYRQQMEEMEDTFGVLLRQLPDRTEVPDLLVDITQAGLSRGLEFVLFKPESARTADFYAIVPVTVQIIGTYHQLAQFVSDLAELPRIVTVGNIDISQPGSSGLLTMNAVTYTYHYLDEEDMAEQQQAGGDQRARTRR